MKVYIKWLAALIMMYAVTISCQDEVLVEDTSGALSADSQLTMLLTVASQQTGSCLAIGYPIKVFAYNSSFQVQNTYTLASNDELYAFLQGIGPNEYYAISYPLAVTASGLLMEATSNVSLEAQIGMAFDACDIEIPGECNNPGVLTNDLILYMTFSNSIEDLAGGTVSATGDISFVEDRSGNAQCAISFGGSQQLQVTHNDVNGLIQGNVFSISVWFRMQNVNPSDYEHLFRKGQQSQSGFNLSVYDGNTPLFGTPSAQVWDNNWNADLELWEDTQNWHHLAITFDVDNTARLYRDGVLQNTETFTADIGTTALDYYIGQNYTGFLDDLRVYKKVLTAAEVQTLFELEGDCSTCME